MADQINTPYLGQGPTTTDVTSVDYVGTGSDTTETEENPREFTSEVSFTDAVTMTGAVNMTSTLDVTGVVGLSSKISMINETGIIADSTATTVSANSSVVGDGELGLFESTLTNVTLIYRSGNTTYHWVSSNGSVG